MRLLTAVSTVRVCQGQPKSPQCRQFESARGSQKAKYLKGYFVFFAPCGVRNSRPFFSAGNASNDAEQASRSFGAERLERCGTCGPFFSAMNGKERRTNCEIVGVCAVLFVYFCVKVCYDTGSFGAGTASPQKRAKDCFGSPRNTLYRPKKVTGERSWKRSSMESFACSC